MLRRIRAHLRWTALPLALSLATCGGRGDHDDETAPRSCQAPPRPQLDARVRWERVFERVSVEDAVSLVKVPGGRWYVLSKTGVIYTFEDRADAQATVFLDLRDRIAEGGEAGLLGLAFPDDFATSGRVFVHYTTPGGTAFLSRLSEFTSADGQTADLQSEWVVLEVDQPYTNHNGGDIHFGPDGHLYWALGDGGSAGDPGRHGQNVNSLLGAMLRLDVSAGYGRPYEIPADNPFAQGGGRPEIFAWGFRNPYRWTFDRDGGQLWVGDVGQHTWEELNRVERGQNYGWRTTEGTDCFGADTCDTTDLQPPHAQYRNTGTASIVTGYAYRGAAMPDLQGTVLYSDFYFGTVFGVPSQGGDPVELGEGARGIAGWAQDDDGELYGVDFFDGSIYALRPAPPASGPDRFPRSILETGCVDPNDLHAPAPGTLAYDVHHPFWSDGADKARFVALPSGGQVQSDALGTLSLPVGTVLVKSFFGPDDRPIETRLLVHHDDAGWGGYSWAWNDAGTDATFVEESRTITIDGTLDGTPWELPGPRDCMACHTGAAGRSLGLETRQLSAETLAALAPDATAQDPLPALDSDAPVADRARAYLHVNCAPCHQEDGNGGRSNLDLRMHVSLEDSGLCDSPRAGGLDLDTPLLVAPGAPERSVLLARMRAEGSARMPPLGRRAVDVDAAAVVEEWISSLDGCP